MALKKNGIVEKIQNGPGFSDNQSVDPTESLLKRIISPLKSGDDVWVSGFGKFCVKEKR